MSKTKNRLNVQFRMPLNYEELLKKEAAKQQISPNEMAKKIVMYQLLSDEDGVFRNVAKLKHILLPTYIVMFKSIFDIMASNPSMTFENATALANEHIFQKANERVQKILESQFGIEG
ncbi:hypothetical protein D8682_00205 (plasmid) [Buttiauxella sp. 3AFRM03]|uniref:hypothetical protein n=1 Tax=Buttiauxella sp. 3AFRM03 TaxID=2479367 RepID=UPI000EF8295B|nr:hypothetical protein [Buttiauxella sp. 3AFRM03]AYN25650.1 hypothetical protein D8682_00205 [Buttiauxella sp. 3AFRM03]